MTLLEFVDKYKKEAECFANERLEDGKTPWPHEQSIEEQAYDTWKSEVANPTTGKYYDKVEENGTRYSARYVIKNIVRIKDSDEKEYLLSNGDLVGYTPLGDTRVRPIHNTEVWEKTTFGHRTIIDPVNPGRTKTVTDGPNSKTLQYTMPFNEENLNKLLANKDDKVRFSVKDSDSDKVVRVNPQATFKDTVRLFLKSDFHYLLTGGYIPEEEKKQARALAERQGLVEMEASKQR